MSSIYCLPGQPVVPFGSYRFAYAPTPIPLPPPPQPISLMRVTVLPCAPPPPRPFYITQEVTLYPFYLTTGSCTYKLDRNGNNLVEYFRSNAPVCDGTLGINTPWILKPAPFPNKIQKVQIPVIDPYIKMRPTQFKVIEQVPKMYPF